MKSYFTFLFLILLAFSVKAQQGQLKGKVVDAATRTPLEGASIMTSSANGTTTDSNGEFSLTCDGSLKITVKYLNYGSYTTTIKNCDQELLISLNSTNASLNTVEITATSARNKSILYQPSSITKLSETELKRGTGLYLDDAINANVPGVTMERRAVSSGQQFNIRGYGNGVRGTNGLNSNFDGQGYKVYLNGIPVTDAEGVTLMDDIDFNSIGNVEVTKGPAGTLYGLAIAGVVNLKTIKPEKGKTSVGQDVLFGSYGQQRYTTHLAIGGERSSLLINYGHQESDGYLLHNSSNKDFVNIAGEFSPNDKQTVNAYFGYSNSYDERAGELSLVQYANKDYSGNPSYIKNNAHSEIIGFRAGLGHTYNFTDNFSNTTSVFASGVTNNSSSAAGWTDKDPTNFGLRSTFDAKFNLSEGFDLSGITGVETQRQNAQTIGYAMVADVNNPAGYNRIGAMRSNQYTISSTTSLFTEWTLSMPQDFSFTAGLGMNNMKISLDDRFYVAATAALPTKYEKTYNGMFSPHFALNKVFSKQFSAYASYSKGYKAPVSAYFYIPATGEVNRNLEAEIGNQYEIGTKGALLNDRLTYQVAVFDAIFSHKMVAVAVPLNSTTTGYSYIANGGKQDDRGVEALVRYTAYQSATGFLQSITPFANFTYSDFKYKDFTFQTLNTAKTDVIVTDYSGKDVAGVAPVMFNAGLDFFANCGLYGNIIYSYKDAMPITSDGVNNTKSYNLLNAKIGFQHTIAKNFKFDAYFGLNNITGTQYPIFVFINQLPDAYIPGPYKTNYFGGINLNYNF